MGYSTLILWILGVAYVATCGVLILIVLLQEGKSGGMAGMDSAAQSPDALQGAFGAGGAQKGLYNATRIGATLFLALALTLTIVGNGRSNQGSGTLKLPAAEQPATTQPVDISREPAIEGAPAPAPADTEAPADAAPTDTAAPSDSEPAP